MMDEHGRCACVGPAVRLRHPVHRPRNRRAPGDRGPRAPRRAGVRARGPACHQRSPRALGLPFEAPARLHRGQRALGRPRPAHRPRSRGGERVQQRHVGRGAPGRLRGHGHEQARGVPDSRTGHPARGLPARGKSTRSGCWYCAAADHPLQERYDAIVTERLEPLLTR
ncbi:hypothetical protein QJS66_16230 [Kocuria rhizophila]|nr:hypothetical protein QJS66_16230 [Kocuria rhizophila]